MQNGGAGWGSQSGEVPSGRKRDCPRSPWPRGSVSDLASLPNIPQQRQRFFQVTCLGAQILWHANEPRGLTQNMGHDDFTRWMEVYLPGKIEFSLFAGKASHNQTAHHN